MKDKIRVGNHYLITTFSIHYLNQHISNQKNTTNI